MRHRVRCHQGIDHGAGSIAWMHPPVHRVLGWASKPSNFNLSRHVWRLDQVKGIADQEIFVKGEPAISDEVNIQRLPTLLGSDLLNLNGEKLGVIADLTFQLKSGKIIDYLIARSNPKIPGTSRWRLTLNHIIDQQPSMVSVNINSLDELPLARSSIKQDILRNSRNITDQFKEISSRASDQLEGWLEETSMEDSSPESSIYEDQHHSVSKDDWVDYPEDKDSEQSLDLPEDYQESSIKNNSEQRDDPWI